MTLVDQMRPYQIAYNIAMNQLLAGQKIEIDALWGPDRIEGSLKALLDKQEEDACELEF